MFEAFTILYLLVGIVLFGAYDNLWSIGKASYAIIFPLHLGIGKFIVACLTHQGNFLNNPVWIVLVPLLLCLLFSS